MYMRRTTAAAAAFTAAWWWDRKGVTAAEGQEVDVTIIGGGVVGLSIARELSCRGVAVRVLEREVEVATGASGGNSGLGCTGFDAAGLERKLLRRSIQLHPNLYRRLGLSYEYVNKCGALMIAWTPEDVPALHECLEELHEAGDTEATILTASAIEGLEPELRRGVLAGIDVGRENIVEPWVVTIHSYRGKHREFRLSSLV